VHSCCKVRDSISRWLALLGLPCSENRRQAAVLVPCPCCSAHLLHSCRMAVDTLYSACRQGTGRAISKRLVAASHSGGPGLCHASRLDQSGSERGFCQSISGLYYQYHSTIALYLFIYLFMYSSINSFILPSLTQTAADDTVVK
jgi:hypothetical protein